MKILSELTEEHVLLSWGEAELGRLVRDGGLPPDVLKRRNEGIRDGEDDELIREKITACRAPMLRGILGNGFKWHQAELFASEIGFVRVVDGWDCPEVMTMSELLVRKPEFAFEKFDLGKMHGFPIFVGMGASDQWCLLEGMHRCLTALRDQDRIAEPLRVIVGISPLVRQWFWWHSNRNGTPRHPAMPRV